MLIVCKMCRDKKDIINFAFNIKFKNCTDDTCSDCRKEITDANYKLRTVRNNEKVEKKRKKRVIRNGYETANSDAKCFDCGERRNYSEITTTGTLLCDKCFDTLKKRMKKPV